MNGTIHKKCMTGDLALQAHAEGEAVHPLQGPQAADQRPLQGGGAMDSQAEQTS